MTKKEDNKKSKYLNFEVTKNEVILNDIIIIPIDVFEKMILVFKEWKNRKEKEKDE